MKTGRGQAKKQIDIMFKRMDREIKDDVKKEMMAVGKKVIKKAIQFAPVDTGYLVQSAFIRAPRKWQNGRTTLSLGFRAHYAKVVELKHATKSKYLQRAFQYVEGEYKPEMKNTVRSNTGRIVINV